jgi:hypothetical protein
MSNLRFMSRMNRLRLASTLSTPESPGPPGASTSAPILAAGSVAGRRARARPNRGPRGWAQSTGTARVPHCAVGSDSHGAQVTAPA